MIDVRELRKSYGDFEALKGVSFNIQRGEIVGFLGPNGAGKSTTMKILTGWTQQSSGEVRIDGLSHAHDGLKVRERIGYLPESTPLYPEMTVYDYLIHVGRVRGMHGASLRAGLKRSCEMCGLTERISQVIGTLSKGYKQRVGLAQALIHDPEVLILDEPTSGLDPNQIVEIRTLIRTLGQDRTILLSTHNLPEVLATCARLLILHQGRLVADGTPDALTARESTRERLSLTLASGDITHIEHTLKARLPMVSALHSTRLAQGEVRVDLEAPREDTQDLRRTVAALAFEQGWPLLELKRIELDLEGLFRQLTREA